MNPSDEVIDQAMKSVLASRKILSVAVAETGGGAINSVSAIIMAYYEAMRLSGIDLTTANEGLIAMTQNESFQQSLVPIFERGGK